MRFAKLPLAAAMASLLAAPVTGHAEEIEIPFDEARLFFELNDTDGDLGIHGKVDGDEWRYLEIEDPHDRKMMNIWIRGRLRRQGLTELFFESAEPTFDELEPAEFFARFPEGVYEIEGITLDYEERESEVYLSHVIPAAPHEVMVGGYPMATKEDCEGEGDPLPIVSPEDDPENVITIAWEPVEMSHAARHGAGGPEPRDIALGSDGIIEVAYYEVVVEVDDTPFKIASIIPGDGETEWDLADDFFELAEAEQACPAPGDPSRMCAQYKYEILARTYVYDGVEPVYVDADEEEQLLGNKSAVESCFLVPEDD